MNSKFVVSHLEQQLGPFSEDEIRAKWQVGDILPIDYVYDEVKQDWVLMSERFQWATGKTSPSPPPLSEVSQKKKRPPDPPSLTIRPETQTNVDFSLAPPVTTKGTTIQIINGVGSLELSPQKAGEVHLVLQNPPAALAQIKEGVKIQVQPTIPATVEWTLPHQLVVGEPLEICIQVLDKTGLICSECDAKFTIRIEGSSQTEVAVDVFDGEAQLKIPNTVAGTWNLSLHYKGSLTSLKMPEARPFEWLAGIVDRLVLDGPHEFLSGHPVKVQLRAVDRYGNLAKSVQGSVTLEIKAS